MNWDIGIDIHTLCCAVLNFSVVSDCLQNHGPQHARLLCPWGVSRQECWSGLPCPPPGDLPNPEIKPGLLLCRLILYWLNHQGSPRIWEWVACPFSRGSSWPRTWTRVSCIVGQFSIIWATREAHCIYITWYIYIYREKDISWFWRLKSPKVCSWQTENPSELVVWFQSDSKGLKIRRASWCMF